MEEGEEEGEGEEEKEKEGEEEKEKEGEEEKEKEGEEEMEEEREETEGDDGRRERDVEEAVEEEQGSDDGEKQEEDRGDKSVGGEAEEVEETSEGEEHGTSPPPPQPPPPLDQIADRQLNMADIMMAISAENLAVETRQTGLGSRDQGAGLELEELTENGECVYSVALCSPGVYSAALVCTV